MDREKPFDREALLELLRTKREAPGETRLRHIAHALRNGDQLTDADRQWFVSTVDELLGGELSPNRIKVVLQLSRRRGRKGTMRACSYQIENARRIVLRMNSGLSYNRAIDEVADELQMAGTETDERTLKLHYSKFAPYVRDLPAMMDLCEAIAKRTTTNKE